MNFKKILCHKKYLLGGLFPFSLEDAYDRVLPVSKTARSMEGRPDDGETGWDRLKMMFTLDDFGSLSSEIISIYQSGFVGCITGAVYGGVISSRIAYVNFMERNQATAFNSHLDAKKKLQDKVTISFAKGAFKWGWRLALFTTTYVGITTIVSVYRGKSSVVEYVSAGAITGAAYKCNLGLRGIAIGGGLGGILGGFAGGISLLTLRLSGTTMEEVRYWQYKWKKDRDQMIKQAMKKQLSESDNMMEGHDETVGEKNLSLDNLASIAETKQ